jgi:hypothetical protein
MTDDRIRSAEQFIWYNGRLLDRHRFAYHFTGGPAEHLLAALRPYQNPDGGFGHGLEPDIRAPISQPQPVELALWLLDEVDGYGEEMVSRILDYLPTVTTVDGGVPFTLPSVNRYPHGPWWESPDDPAASINPTGPIAGLLDRHGIEHPWLPPALDYCWESLSTLDKGGPYDLRAAVAFLDHVRDRDRAEAAVEPLGSLIHEHLDGGHVSLFDFAPEPSSVARRLFRDETVSAHLDALEAGQQADGGWTVGWPIWTPAAGFEWRSWVTVQSLRWLRAYDRL